MAPESHLAACQDCGHRYKVPSADRTYNCKQCGGTVAVEQAKAPRRASQGSRSEASQRPQRSRREPRKEKKPWGILVAVLVAVGGIGAFLMMDRGGTVGAAA